MNEFDDLDMIPLRWWESVAFWGVVAMAAGVLIGTISFATGYAWAYLRAGILSLGL
jgi:hypothetical protein